MKKTIFSYLLLAFVSFTSIIQAQDFTCGFDAIQSTQPVKLQIINLDGSTVRPLSFTGMVYIPIYITVFTKSDGTYGSTKENIYRSIARMNYSFAKSGVQFYTVDSIKYVKNDTLNNWEASKDEGTALALYGHNDGFNLFVVDAVKISGVVYGGYYSFNGITQSVIAGSSGILNGSLMEHEFGHGLGMLHTFQNSNSVTITDRELVVRPPDARANCSTAGDLICDTPADPYISNGASISYGCTYTGTATDALGMSYSPDLSNIMSYYGCKGNYFSPGQFTRMNTFFNNNYTFSYSFLTATGTNVTAPTSLSLLSTDGIYFNHFTWHDNSSNEQGFVLEISTNTVNGFYSAAFVSSNTNNVKIGGLQRNTTYYARVKPINSKISVSNIITFQTGSGFYDTPKFYRTVSNSGYPYDFINGAGANYTGFSVTSLTGFSEEVYNLNKTLTIAKGTAFLVNAGLNNCFNYANHILWIDYNQNGNFNDQGESVMTAQTYFNCLNAVVTVASTMANGLYKARLASLPDAKYSNESSGLITADKFGYYDFNLNVINSDTITLLLKALTVTSYGTKLSWSGNLSSTKNINILRSLSSTGGFVSVGISIASVTSFTDNNSISPNTTYYYKIASYEYPSVMSTVRKSTTSGSIICSPSGYSPPVCGSDYRLRYLSFKGANYTSLNVVDTACNSDNFSDLLLDTVYVARNKKYPYTLKATANCGGYASNVSIFADFNHDGAFTGTNETLKIFSASGVCFYDSLYIPSSIPTGNYTLRIFDQGSLVNNGACGTYPSYIQMKFYDVTLKVIANDSSSCRPSGYSAPICNYGFQMKYMYFRGANFKSLTVKDTVCPSGLFSDLQSDTIHAAMNKKYPFSLQLDKSCGGAAVYLGIYADFNKDGQFNGPNETLKLYSTPGVCFNDSLVVPSGVAFGAYQLRIFYLQNQISNGPCGGYYSYSQGKFYDFTLKVIAQDSALYYCDLLDVNSTCSPVKIFDFILTGSSGTGINNINMDCTNQPHSYVQYPNNHLVLYTNHVYSFVAKSESGCTKSTTGGFFGNNIGLWIDYNNNKSFTDAGESIIVTNFNSSNYPCVITGFFTVPGVVSKKPTILRLRSRYYAYGTVDPCTQYTSFSDSEDYTVLLADSGQPMVITNLANIESEKNDIELYPVPSEEKIYLKIKDGNNAIKFTHYEIYSISGIKIKGVNMGQSNIYDNDILEISIDGLSVGTYCINLYSSDSITRRLFVKSAPLH